MFEALILVLFPLIIANVLHMLLVKNKLFRYLEIPINKRLFGGNKTWRGFIFLIISTALFCSLFGWMFNFHSFKWNSFLVAILGFTYMVFELPNSMFKRYKGIASGESPNKGRIYFLILDKTDSSLGVSLVYTLLSNFSITDGILLFFLCSGLHIFISLLLVFLKVKKNF